MLKVAFATSDGVAVDQHFGWCRRFDVYEVSAQSTWLVETRLLDPADDDEAAKIESRLARVRDCAILNVCDIGGSAAAKVISARIHPMKVANGTLVGDLVARLQGVLGSNPPPWLRKVLRQHGAEPVPTWVPAGGAS